MRKQNQEFLYDIVQKYGPFENILDVGSGDVNGNIRYMFSGKNYIGVDMRPGPNVDIVMNGHDLTKFFEPCSFDLVVCFDTLEHDDKFWLTVYEMRKVVKSGGWMVIGVPGQNTPLHDHPGDYWRFMQESMGLWFYDFVELFFQEQKDDIAHQFTDEIVGRGRKR